MTPKNRIIPFFIPNYGCTNCCVFCNQKKITGYSECIQPKTVGEKLASIDGALAKYQVAFYGGSFTVLPLKTQLQLLDAVQPFIKSGVISDIRISTRPDAISKQILLVLKDYGVSTIELGAQSMDDSVLEVCGRGHNSNDTIVSSKLIKENGFHLILQMMTGLPGSSFEKDYYTALEISRLEPDGVRIYPTVILRDTELAKYYERGEYQEHSLEDAVTICSSIFPIFQDMNIPIIRIGLNPTSDLSGGEVIGGAYHPALGELVISRVYRNKIESEINLSSSCFNNCMSILVSPSAVSKFIGQKRENIIYFKNKYKFKSVDVIPSNELNDGEFHLTLK